MGWETLYIEIRKGVKFEMSTYFWQAKNFSEWKDNLRMKLAEKQNLDVQLMWRPWHPNFSIKIVCFFEIGSKCLTKAPRVGHIAHIKSYFRNINMYSTGALGCWADPTHNRPTFGASAGHPRDPLQGSPIRSQQGFHPEESQGALQHRRLEVEDQCFNLCIF